MSYTLPMSRPAAVLSAAAIAIFSVLAAPQAAMAAPSDVTVTPDDIVAGTPWEVGFEEGTAHWEIIADADAHYGTDALHLTTPANNDAVGLYFDLGAGTNLNAFTMSYATKQLSAQSYALPGIFLYVELNNPDAFGAGAYIYVGYEPAYNNPGALDTKQWQDWAITSTSSVWVPGDEFTSTTRYGSYTIPLSTIVSDPDLADAKVMGVYLNQGSGNAGWDALLDKVNLGTDVTYNFQLPRPIVLANNPTPTPTPTATTGSAVSGASLAATGTEATPVLVGAGALLLFGSALFMSAILRRKALSRKLALRQLS